MSLYVCPAASCLPDFLLCRNTQALKTQTLPDRQRVRSADPAPPPHNTHMCTHSISPLHPSIHSLPPSPAVRGLKHLSQNSTAALKREKARKRKKQEDKKKKKKNNDFCSCYYLDRLFVCFLQRFQSVPLTCVRINHVGRLSSLRSFFYKYIYMIPFSHSLSSPSTSSSSSSPIHLH